MNKNGNLYFLDWLEKNTPFTKQIWLDEISKSGDGRKEKVLKNNHEHLRNAIDVIYWERASTRLHCNTNDLLLIHMAWEKFYDDNIKHHNIIFAKEKIENFKIIPEIDKIIHFEN